MVFIECSNYVQHRSAKKGREIESRWAGEVLRTLWRMERGATHVVTAEAENRGDTGDRQRWQGTVGGL